MKFMSSRCRRPERKLPAWAGLMLVILCSGNLHVTSTVADDTASEIDFAREILPILSNKCFVCHGPDAEDDFLRLDSYSAATADLGGYQAIAPDALPESNLIQRIESDDDPMPPADAEKQLSSQERDLLKRWIEGGGEYAKHWAFIAPKKSADHDGSSPAAIDALIQQQLNDNEVKFAAPADKATLARRVALTLTGLPPEPEQLRAFLANEADDAYEQFVDMMLDSPRFGEHQARYWLDAVRYGDTHGLHLDNRRGIYPYRDWVVSAMNDNLPLDDFITWQLAGDLLPEPTLAQQVASGFVRMNPSTSEGGAIAAEFQAKNSFDRVENFGTVFLGMSLTCARCHTHKYDPIPHVEYYRLMAFFNSTAESPLDGNSYTYGPTARVPQNQAGWQAWKVLEKTRNELLRKAETELQEPERLSAAVKYASERVSWKASDWRITKPIAADREMPAEDAADAKKSVWQPAKGLPGSISGKKAKGAIPGEGQATWVSFQVEVPTDQTLQLHFSGAPQTSVYVDRSRDPVATKTTHDRTNIFDLTLTAGNHPVENQVRRRE